MGQSSGKTMKSDDTKKTPEELRRDIAQTRAQMTNTVSAIEEKLPQTIKAKAEETITDVKHMASEAVEQAKHVAVEHYQEAKAAVKQEVSEQVRAVKHEVSEQVREARYAVRQATIGRVENMVHRAGDSVNEAGNTIFDTIRENPIPSALVGLGLTWLLMNGRSSRRHDRHTMRSARSRYLDEGYGANGYGDYDDHTGHTGIVDRGRDAVLGGARRVRGAVNEGMHDASAMAHDVRDRVQGAAHDVSERVQGAASSARHAAGEFVDHTTEGARALAIRAQREAVHLGHEASLRAQRAERSAERLYENNPLAVGAAALAVGAMVGLAIPHTDREDELMGTVRDRLIDQGEKLATGAMDKASDMAKEKLGKSNGDRTTMS